MVGRIRNDVLTSGQLGTATGVSADTIRHYEKLGLLPKPLRTEGGYRIFPANSVVRVRTIRCALKAGFSLVELAGILGERDSGGAPCRRVAAMASEKVAGLERQITELIGLRDWLSATVEGWRACLDRTPPGQPARLLEGLAKQAIRAEEFNSKGPKHEDILSNACSVPDLGRLRPKRSGLPDARSASRRG